MRGATSIGPPLQKKVASSGARPSSAPELVASGSRTSCSSLGTTTRRDRGGRRPARSASRLRASRPNRSSRGRCRHSLRERRRFVEAPLFVRGAAIAAQAALREARERRRQLARRVERSAGLDEAVRESHAQRFVAADAAAGEDQIERVAHADRGAAAAACRRRPAARPSAGSRRRRRRRARRRAGRTRARVRDRPRRRSPRPRRSPASRGTSASAPSARRRRRPTRLPPPPEIAFRSAPAQKVPPAPVRIATASAGSASKRRNASASAAAVGPSTALRTAGRSIVTMQSGPSISKRTVAMAFLPGSRHSRQGGRRDARGAARRRSERALVDAGRDVRGVAEVERGGPRAEREPRLDLDGTAHEVRARLEGRHRAGRTRRRRRRRRRAGRPWSRNRRLRVPGEGEDGSAWRAESTHEKVTRPSSPPAPGSGVVRDAHESLGPPPMDVAERSRAGRRDRRSPRW